MSGCFEVLGIGMSTGLAVNQTKGYCQCCLQLYLSSIRGPNILHICSALKLLHTPPTHIEVDVKFVCNLFQNMLLHICILT